MCAAVSGQARRALGHRASSGAPGTAHPQRSAQKKHGRSVSNSEQGLPWPCGPGEGVHSRYLVLWPHLVLHVHPTAQPPSACRDREAGSASSAPVRSLSASLETWPFKPTPVSPPPAHPASSHWKLSEDWSAGPVSVRPPPRTPLPAPICPGFVSVRHSRPARTRPAPNVHRRPRPTAVTGFWAVGTSSSSRGLSSGHLRDQVLLCLSLPGSQSDVPKARELGRGGVRLTPSPSLLQGFSMGVARHTRGKGVRSGGRGRGRGLVCRHASVNPEACEGGECKKLMCYGEKDAIQGLRQSQDWPGVSA